EDLALIAPQISGPDYRDAACIPVPWSDPETVELDKLRGAFFVTNGRSKTDTATEQIIRRAAAALGEVAAGMSEDCPAELIETIDETRGKLSMGDGWQWYQRLAD